MFYSIHNIIHCTLYTVQPAVHFSVQFSQVFSRIKGDLRNSRQEMPHQYLDRACKTYIYDNTESTTYQAETLK